MKKILILGAGPAGLSCGMELSSNGYSGVILEKNSKIGGLAKTIKFEENYYTFRTDIGPHRFFSKNKYIHSYISNILDDKWIDVKRSTMQYIDGKYFDYPINPLQAFKNIGLIKTIKFCIDYLKSVIIYIIFKKKIETFEEYIFSKFGKSLAKFNITNYTEKVWGMSCKELHPDWAKERIKGLSFFSVIKNMLFGINQTKSLVQYFKYPENGTGEIYETIGEKICTTDFKIFENTYPIKIIHNNNKIKKIEFKIKNLVKNIEPEHIISSIPITEFISLMNPKPPIKILNASKNLKWRSQVYLFITLNKKRVTKNQWIYFPNINIPFGRISEMKNFSKKMSPKNKTSILIEYFTWENDKIWKMNKEEIFELSLPFFEKMNFFKRSDVRKYYHFKKKFVYPVYELNYKKNLKIIEKYLNSFSNLIYIGRPGKFKYTNQDQSIEMGINAAKKIINLTL